MGTYPRVLGPALFIAATTIGAGIFALPYVFEAAGWLLGLVYMAVFSAVIVFSHYLYWRMLRAENEKIRLLGLVRKHLGEGVSRLGLAAVVLGLIFTLTAYLLLAAKFFGVIFPGSGEGGLIIFWFLGSIFALARLKWFSGLEIAAAFFMAGIVFFLFFMRESAAAISFNVVRPDLLLPIGPLLFSLAGWTALEPVFETEGERERKRPLPMMFLGTAIAAVVYIFFVLAVANGKVAPDTISGLSSWPLWKKEVLAVFGLFALWTSYIPILLEIKNEFQKDFHLPWNVSFLFAILLPLLLVIGGVNNFFSVISLVGGLFLALQYILILLTGARALRLKGFLRVFMVLALLIFILGIAGELYYFI